MKQAHSSTKVILTGVFVVDPETDLESIKQALILHRSLTLAEPGCLRFEVAQDRLNERQFHVEEAFCDMSALLKHQQRAENSAWGEITKTCQREYQIAYI